MKFSLNARETPGRVSLLENKRRVISFRCLSACIVYTFLSYCATVGYVVDILS